MMGSGHYLIEKYIEFYEKYGDKQADCEDDLMALLRVADQFFDSNDLQDDEALFAAWNIYDSGVRYSLPEILDSVVNFESVPEKKENRLGFISARETYHGFREKAMSIMAKLGGKPKLPDSDPFSCQN